MAKRDAQNPIRPTIWTPTSTLALSTWLVGSAPADDGRAESGDREVAHSVRLTRRLVEAGTRDAGPEIIADRSDDRRAADRSAKARACEADPVNGSALP